MSLEWIKERFDVNRWVKQDLWARTLPNFRLRCLCPSCGKMLTNFNLGNKSMSYSMDCFGAYYNCMSCHIHITLEEYLCKYDGWLPFTIDHGKECLVYSAKIENLLKSTIPEIRALRVQADTLSLYLRDYDRKLDRESKKNMILELNGVTSRLAKLTDMLNHAPEGK